MCKSGWLRKCWVAVIFLESEQTVPEIDAVSTGAELKEHSISNDLSISDLESLLQLADQGLNQWYQMLILPHINNFKEMWSLQSWKLHSCHAKELTNKTLQFFWGSAVTCPCTTCTFLSR